MAIENGYMEERIISTTTIRMMIMWKEVIVMWKRVIISTTTIRMMVILKNDLMT